MRGTIGITALLSDGRGWSRELRVAPERAFTGAETTIAGTVDLARVQRLTRQLEQLTGSSQAAYSLTLAAHVTADGVVDGRALDAAFSPEVELELADQRLQPKLDGDEDTFLQRQPGEATVAVEEAIRLGRAQLAVADARWIGSIALAYSLLAAAAALLLSGRRGIRDEPARIAARHGRMLVEVASHSVDPSRVLDLPDMSTLARIAEHHGRLILHTVEGGAHVYLVEEGETVFRYRAAGSPRLADALA